MELRADQFLQQTGTAQTAQSKPLFFSKVLINLHVQLDCVATVVQINTVVYTKQRKCN